MAAWLTNDASSARWRSVRWFWCLPSALLIGVALIQIWLVYAEALSPWSGGGFGMFSTTDAGMARHLHAFAIRPGIRRELRIPQTLEKMELRVLTLPTKSNLRALAYELAEVPTPDAGPLQSIAVQVWATRFDPDNLEPSGFIMRSLEVRIGEP